MKELKLGEKCSRNGLARMAVIGERSAKALLLLIGGLGIGLALPVHGQGMPMGEATRQVHPDGDPTNPANSAGLKGGESDGGGCNIPTDAAHSPLFGAKPFTQSVLRFEEFGSRPLPAEEYAYCKQNYDRAGEHYCMDMPSPTLGGSSENGNFSAYGRPADGLFDSFLAQPLFPYPTEEANMNWPNPWEQAIVEEHTGPMEPLIAGSPFNTVADGRPPGPQFAHQRWQEFFPKVYTQTVQAGVRNNGGFRDSEQSHGYSLGEFAPGGLHHNTVHGMKAAACAASTDLTASASANESACLAVANPAVHDHLDKMCKWNALEESCTGIFDGTTVGIPVRFHPLMPVQDHQALRTFDGTLPPKLELTRYMEAVLFRHYNALPIKFESNRGFGNHFISTHHHNGHNPAESDGFAQAFFLPGQFYDYHWPMILAGHDPRPGNPTNNPKATEKRASTPCDESTGEQIVVSYPSPLTDSEGASCTRAQQLAENLSWDGNAYADGDACGWRAVPETCDENGRIQIPGDWRETMSTLWFHDHMLDYTAQNVYKGNAAMMNMYSGPDPGREGWKCHQDDPENNVNLCLPSGSSQKWGNRDYDVNLVLGGKAWGQDTSRYKGSMASGNPTGEDPVENLMQGQLWFATFNTDGFMGDRMTVNWLYDPYMDVRARRYRIRMLNGHISRFLRNALVVQRNDNSGEFPGESPGISYDRVPFHLVANDGNIMQYSIAFDGSKDLDGDGDIQEHNAILPTQAIAERWDLVVDFSENNPANLSPGDTLYWVQLLEHKNGKRPHRAIPLEEVLSGEYAGDGVDTACDTVVGKFLEVRIQPCTKADGSPAANCQVGGEALSSQQDRSMDPGLYVEGNTNGPGETELTMIPMPRITTEELENAHHRTFVFGRGGATDSEPKTITEAQGTNSAAPSRVPVSSDAFIYEVNGESVNLHEHETLPVVADLPWGVKTDGGKMLNADMHRTSAAPRLGDLEVWHIVNGGGGWSHNVHVHFEEGRILRRDGKAPPDWEKWSRKDVYRVGRMDDSGSDLTVALRFREFGGAYMEHCHNTQHEDHAMLLRWDIENPGQLKPFLTPEPQWNGCGYTESFDLETARTQENGFDRPDELIGDVKAKEDFDKDGSARSFLCTAGAVEECVAGSDGGAGDVSTNDDDSPDGDDNSHEARAERRAEKEAQKAAKKAERRARKEAREQARLENDSPENHKTRRSGRRRH